MKAPLLSAPFVRVAALLLAAIVLLVLQNVAIARLFPLQSRLSGDFSTAYLRRHLQTLAGLGPQTMFLGDGLLAGFRLPPNQTAVADLSAGGCACRNLAYVHGSPVNYYALALLMRAYGIHPKTVVLEINQAQYNPSFFGYRRMPGAIGELSWPLLSADDRAALEAPRPGLRQRVLGAVGSVSLLVAMRTDIRTAMFGTVEPKPPPMSLDDRRRLYDLAPLDDANLSVRYLAQTLDALHAQGTPVTAFMAPVNHAAFHDFIDNAAYRANAAYLRRLLERHGVRALDLDEALGAADFEDEVHLNAAGQRRLATLLEPIVGQETRARASHVYVRRSSIARQQLRIV